jgi:hypothetical protein
MPSCKHFRVVILDDKPIVKITALHLYNNDTRVDQNATLSTGFTSNSAQLEYLKNTSPSSNNVFEINLTSIRPVNRFIRWTFAADTNVNCFQIGFGDLESNSLQKFKLQFSLDGLSWENIVFVGPDKKLAFTSAYSFSDLKPNGQCFPFLLSKVNHSLGWHNNSYFAYGPKIGSDRRSIITGKQKLSTNLTTSYVSSHGWLLGGNSELSGNLEGIFNKGKFYFEVSTFSENNINFSTNSDNTWVYNCLNLAIAATNNERVASTGLRNNSTIYKTIGLNLPKYSSLNTGFLPHNQNLFNRTLTPKTKFTPGVQHGILLDFDNKQSWFLNPTWTSAAPGKYPFTTDPLAALTGNSFLLALMFNNYGVAVDFLDDIYLNFGQSTFANPVPDGYNPGIGPRWNEVADDEPKQNNSIGWFLNSDNLNLNLNPTKEHIELIKQMLPFNNDFPGNYYIKGRITKQPDNPNKQFFAVLLEHSTQSLIDVCLANKEGYYEFYGIANTVYSVLSIDLKNNVVSETIGPIMPAEII